MNFPPFHSCESSPSPWRDFRTGWMLLGKYMRDFAIFTIRDNPPDVGLGLVGVFWFCFLGGVWRWWGQKSAQSGPPHSRPSRKSSMHMAGRRQCPPRVAPCHIEGLGTARMGRRPFSGYRRAMRSICLSFAKSIYRNRNLRSKYNRKFVKNRNKLTNPKIAKDSKARHWINPKNAKIGKRGNKLPT